MFQATSMSTTLFFLFLCLSSPFAGRAAAVHIGAIVDPSSRTSREQRVAIGIAVEDFSSSVSDGLSLNVTDSSNKVESLIAEWGANAIITAGPWPEAVQISKIAGKTRVPVLSLTTSTPLPPASKPNLLRLSSSASAYIQCLTDIVKLYNWRQLIVLYEDDEYGTTSASLVPLLNNALRTVGSAIISHVAFPPLDSLSDPKGLVHQELDRLSKELCRVFIIVRWSSPSLAMDLFEEAEALGLMARGSVWITGDDITSLLDSTFKPSFISSYMQGVIGIKTYFNGTSESYSNFTVKFRQRFQAAYNGETSFEPGMPALQAYDAVHVIARARATMEGIWSTKFIGLSGEIQFSRDGELVDGKDSSAFRVINIVGKSYREMGIWSKGVGFHGDERSVSSLGAVYWPGGAAGGAPGGWSKLRLGIPARAVFDKFVKVEVDDDGKPMVSGFCIEVFKMAWGRLNYTLDYEFHPFNRSYDELVAAVPEEFDGAVGDVTILAERLGNATFTEPFLPSGLMAFVPVRTGNTRWVLTKPFTKQVWLLLALSYIYTCIIVWYLEQKHNPEFHGPWNAQVGATLWFIFSAIFFAQGKIHSYYTKIVIGVWLFVLLILASAFTASLGSILTTQKLEPVVSDDRIGCNADSFAVDYLPRMLGYKAEQIKRIQSVENYRASFESGSITKAYLQTPHLRVFLAEHEGYTVYGDTKRLGGFGFVFPKDSPLIADFSKAILELTEDGTLNDLEEKWFSLSMNTCPATAKDRIRESLGLESLWTLFLITGAASTIVLLLFKARFITSYSCRSLRDVSLPLRERCSSLWKYKLSDKIELQFSRRPSSSCPQVVPEPGDGSPEAAGSHGSIQCNAECGDLTRQNNV